ncbi:MAG: peptidylprolyl isomerase [Phycisphaerales bacterium]
MSPRPMLTLLCLTMLGMPTAGCGTDRSLDLGSFTGEPVAPRGTNSATTYAATPSPAPEPTVWASDLSLSSPAADATDPGPAPPQREPLLFDAKVGDINGRPILASVFLADLMPRLEALRRTAPNRGAWVAEARRIIADKVSLTVQDEVLYREGRAQLPEEIRQGLFSFVQLARQNIRRAYSGSAVRADQQLREETGLGLEETLDLEKRQAIIAEVLRKVASSYPEPTWADVQNEYQRRYAEFNPPKRVFARMIFASSTDAAREIGDRLHAGEAFAAVAQDDLLNRFRASEGGQIDAEGREVVGAIEEAELVGIDELNAALVALTPGEWAGPIAFGGGRAGFVMLERIEQSGRSLEDGDLQLQLRAEIQWRRLAGAQQDFINDLLEAAELGPAEQARITEQLLDVAYARVFGVPR